MLGKAVFRDFCRSFGRILFVSVLCIMSQISYSFGAAYNTLTYDCGIGSGTQPATQYNYNGINGTPLTIQNNNNCDLSGSEFVGWLCYLADANPTLGEFYSPGDSYTLYAENVICVARYENRSPCDPGNEGRIEVLGATTESPVDPGVSWVEGGMTFGDLLFLGQQQVGSNRWLPNNGGGPYGLGFDNGFYKWMIEIAGRCSSVPGTPGEQGNPTSDANGNYCWCSIDGYNPDTNDPSIEEVIPLNGYPWVYLAPQSNCDDDSCAVYCMEQMYAVKWGVQSNFWSYFLYSMYTKNICEYSLIYNCANSAYGISGQLALSGGYYEGGEVNVPLWSASGNSVGNCTVPSGYEFGGWTCNTTESPAVPVTVDNNILSVYYNSINVMPSYNVVCTGSWTQIPTYSLTYNCNNSGAGGNAPGGSSHYAGDTNITLAADGGNCIPPLNGMSFTDWSCHKGDDSSVPYSEGDAMPAYDVICDAQWDCDTANGYTSNGSGCTNEYTISYNPGNHGQVIIVAVLDQG